MAEKSQNEILAEQRKARKQYLELKKMQQEDTAPEREVHREAELKTPEEKAKHIWYYYKWGIILVVLAAVILAVSVRQCVTATKYDFGIVAFTYSSVSTESLEKLADYMAEQCEDINGDGEVNIEIINCSYDAKAASDAQYQTTVHTKVQAILSADHDKLIYITDSDGYKFIMGEENENDGLFTGEPYVITEEQRQKMIENEIYIPEGTQISLRAVEGTWLEGKKGIDDIFSQSQKALEKLKQY